MANTQSVHDPCRIYHSSNPMVYSWPPDPRWKFLPRVAPGRYTTPSSEDPTYQMLEDRKKKLFRKKERRLAFLGAGSSGADAVRMRDSGPVSGFADHAIHVGNLQTHTYLRGCGLEWLPMGGWTTNQDKMRFHDWCNGAIRATERLFSCGCLGYPESLARHPHVIVYILLILPRCAPRTGHQDSPQTDGLTMMHRANPVPRPA